MAIPISYNIKSIRKRFTSTIIAILGIAGVVAVFIAMLSMANGFQETLKLTGSADNVMVRRGGSNSEMESAISLDQVKIIADSPQIKRSPDNIPLYSPEVVVIAALPMVSTGTDANVQVRGVSANIISVRDKVKIIKGRFIKPGINEIIVGSNATNLYKGLKLGEVAKLGSISFNVVGVFDSGGSAFDSEVWCDSKLLNQTFKRPDNIFQSVTCKLSSEKDFNDFKDTLSKDPRLTIKCENEIAYYERQSKMISTFIRVLGFMVAFVMGIGAIFGALNTMYASVSSRSTEIATLRSIGFSRLHVVISFVLESVFLSIIGGILGSFIALPFNGFTASTINWTTFSHLAFAFKITPAMIVSGLIFAILMGAIGGFFPAIRAARQDITKALRGM